MAALGPATAAAQGATGTIRGVVTDPGRVALAGAAVTVVSIGTAGQHETVTDAAGRFIATVPAGRYEVSASLPDFAVRRQEDITLGHGETVTLRLELDKAREPDTITVNTVPRVVDAARSFAGGGVSGGELLMLPSIDRRAVDLARLVPGPHLLPLVIDGTHADDQSIPLEAVGDLQVVNAAPPSDSAGPVTALVSRSGSRRFSGSAFDFVRDGRSQFGGTLGGPIAMRRHFFFASYDGTRTGTPDGDATRHGLFARTDHLLADAHRLTLRIDDAARSRVMVSSASAMGPAFNDLRVMATGDSRQLADTLTFVSGAHLMRSGFDVGSAEAGGSGIGRFGLFIEDQWWVASSTTIDVGIRYGRERRPFIGVIDADADWQPRVGAAWSGAEGRLAVRGAYRGLGNGVRHATTGAEWEWMPRVSVGAGYLEYRVAGERAGGLTAELYRRFLQGVHFRVAYTRGIGAPAGPLLAALLPRHRLNASFLYNTTLVAGRYDGLLQTLLEDWTIGGIAGHQSSRGLALDPRAARDIALGGTFRVTLLWEAFNLLNDDEQLTPRTHQVAARLSF